MMTFWQQDSLTSGSQSDLRQGNLTTIMQLLQQQTLLTRSNLARITRLNRATITRLVADLSASGFVRENGLENTGPGRPSIPLEINPEAGYVIGAEIATDFVEVILTDFAQQILWRDKRSFPQRATADEVLPILLAVLCAAMENIPNPQRPLYGISIGVQGLVDTATNTLLFAPNLGWRDVKLGEWLSPHFGAPIFVDNVASLSALGESYFGAATGSPYVLYISTQYGIGGRLIMNNIVLRGASGVAGEIGHMTIDVNGKQCTCGKRGCWETVASQKAALDLARERLKAHTPSILPQMMNGQLDNLSIRVLVDAANQNDDLARTVLVTTGQNLGIGIANLINALNPQRIIIGGELTIAQQYLLPQIAEVVQQQALQWSRANCEILIAKHGSDTTLMGAIARVYQETIHNLEQWVR
jgi:glucokinase-like ROK family protein